MIFIFKTGDKDSPYVVEELKGQAEAIDTAKKLIVQKDMKRISFFQVKEYNVTTVNK